MKKFITLLLSYFLVCNCAHAIIDASLPAAAPGAINKDLENMQKYENEEKIIEQTEKEKPDRDIDGENLPKPKKDIVLEDGSVYNPKFYLKSIKIEGNTIFPPLVLESMTNKITGKEVYLEDVLDVVIDISRYFQNKGYLTSYAYLPPQEIKDGMVVIKIQESPINEVKISGNKWTKDYYLKNIMGSNLKPGKVFNAKNIQGALKTLNREDYIQGTISISKDNQDKTNLELKVKDRFPWRFDVAWDDFGRDYTGTQRATMILGMDNLTGYGDKIYGGTVLSTGSTGALAGYSLPIGPWGTKISYDFNYSNVRLGGPYQDLGVKGNAMSHLFTLTQPIYRSATTDIIGHVGFDMPSSQTTIDGLDSPISDYRLRVLRIGFDGLRDDKYGRWVGGIGSDIGINGLGATKSVAGSPARGEFYKFTASVTRIHRLPFRSLGILRLAGQYTPNALFPYEQMQIGGPYSLRGYQPGQLLGDYGVSGTVEIRTPIPGLSHLPGKWKIIDDRLRFALFYDFGYVKEHENQYNYPTNFLHSVGFGFHATITKFLSAQIGVGFPLQRAFNESPARLYFSVSSEVDKIFCRNIEKL